MRLGPNWAELRAKPTWSHFRGPDASSSFTAPLALEHKRATGAFAAEQTIRHSERARERGHDESLEAD